MGKQEIDKKFHNFMKRVLFVCVENAARSQMAEAFFRKYASKDFDVVSAGVKPVNNLNPLAIEVMKEKGIDMTGQKSKIVEDSMFRDVYKTVNMGCMDKDSCPALFLESVEDWGIEDPKGKTIQKVREIRDEIEKKVINMVKEL